MLQQQECAFDAQPRNFSLLLMRNITAYYIVQVHICASLSVKKEKIALTPSLQTTKLP
ncbi:hypothetical protein yaldo0001_28150 [Yersinia aldovae ATCC 35236]|nr:hypothetical protein yaldo0001_28150 [Yersinia aldovae ATCC 35236]